MQKELLSISQCLLEHPVLNEKTAYRIRYINVLEYFTNKYSKDDDFAQQTLNLYKSFLLGDCQYIYDVHDIKKAAKRVTGVKFKGYRLFSYRYILLFDCLFINSFNNKLKAKKIENEVKMIFHKRYHKRIDELFLCLYEDGSDLAFSEVKYQIKCWKDNKNFLNNENKSILVTANMSAGKSTLVNALVGKRINRTQNDTCTAKLHYIFNKPFEDGFSYEWDYDLELDANLNTLMVDNPKNTSTDIYVGTYFRTFQKYSKQISLIDTPGVNSALNETHRALSYDFIEQGKYDTLICVLNASNIGTIDDMLLFEKISKVPKDKEIILVVNQLDKFDIREDSIEDCLNKVREDTIRYGLENAIICPISAYAGVLAKKYLYKDSLTELEKLEIKILGLKFNDFYSSMKKFFKYKDEVALTQTEDELENISLSLIEQAGIINLERILFE